jgi:protein-disulfide isomerase
MRHILLLFLTLVLCLDLHAQTSETIATSSIKTFTIADLPEATQVAWNNKSKSIADARRQLASQMLDEILLTKESKIRGISPEKLVAAERAKVSDPNEQQIQAVYDANRDALANKSPLDAKKQVIKFLRQDPEQAALRKFNDSLAVKFKVVRGKDVNAPGLQPTDVIFTIDGESITAKAFEDKFKLMLFDVEADIYDQVLMDLEDTVYSTLVAEEAKSQGVDASTIIGREVTNKLHDFTDEERLSLQDAFLKRLYDKYKVNITFREPKPIVQNISPDDDPARGSSTAPVTVIMFSDFQCPACSGTHPVLKRILSEFGDKVRFVVRDFPLTSIHDHALLAAKAAGAANAQGKFFDYIELLYTHQDALDLESLKKYAADIGLNVKQFELDLSSEKIAAEVQKDIADGRSYGIYSTPSIFVNGAKVHRLSAEGFRDAISAALGK